MDALSNMHSSILIPLVALAALAIYKIVMGVVERQRDAAFARQHDCLPEPVVPDDGFLGFGLIKKMQAADKNRMFMNWIEERTDSMSRRHGRQVSTYSTAVLGKKGFYTCDPKNIQAILAHNFEDFDLGKLRRAIMGATLGDGIFTLDGADWSHSRAMLRPNFARDQVSDLGMNERHVQDLFTVMPVQANGWTDFTNIQELFFRMTVDSATEFLFGESTHTQIKAATQLTSGEKGQRDERAFAQHFDSAQNFMSQKFRLSELHWLYNPKALKNDTRIVHEFVDYYVKLALAKGKTEAKSGEKYVFLEALAQQTRDPIVLRSQLLNILLAGRDTTSSLLCWVFHELLRHPETFDKLRHTILATFGPYDESDTSAITFTSLKSCTYLQHTLSEALRLWPVVPGNSRRSNKRTTLPRGGGPDGLSPVFIPADTQVDYSVHNMMRRTDLWGDDAATFRPERFEGRKVGWDFLPFNGGPRICIGQQFALTEASYVVVRILQRFDKIEAPAGALDGPIEQNLTLTSCPNKPVTLKARLAKV